MYKVLIIDDEEPVREAIKILGDWKGLGVGEVLEATDGRSGLAMLKEHKPDVVIVDMKMPEMNGVEFLQIVEREYPELFTIVVSGYNDFEFTRQAIRSKVVDYLLKPVNRQDLNQGLRKALDVLKAKRQSESEFINRNIALNMSLPKLKEKMYVSIIEGTFKKQTNEAFLPLIGADDPSKRFNVAAVRILNLDEVRTSLFHNDIDLLHFAAANVINEIGTDSVQCFSFVNPKQEREMVAVYTMTDGNEQDLAFSSLHLMKRAAAALGELLRIRIAAGIGSPCGDALGIAESYEAAKAALSGIDLLKLNGTAIAPYTAERSLAREGFSIAGRMAQIRSALEAGHIHQAKTVLGEFTKKIKAGEAFGLGDAERIVQEFIVLLNDAALELGVPQDKLPSGERGLRAAGVSTDYGSFEQFEGLINRILEFYGAQIRQSAATVRSFQVSDIKEYIDRHYFEDIKISMFTERYFLSREYLMKLFKQQYGYGIHEYVQKVRMDKAKELLNDSNLKIQEISEMLGYKDKNYFSKAFRNYYSISPTEYRMKHTSG
ncbi:response regulator [Cohnella laeviribosi]|uniref:response regulator n=1 Tax=Cohnella laeviribosi TaxID=380174 RepID=UPI003D19F206